MKTTWIAVAVLCLLTACGGESSQGSCGGAGGLASTTGAGGLGGHGNTEPAGGYGGGAACVCDCEPTAPSTHPLAYCEDPAHDGLPCCRDDGAIGGCSQGACVAPGGDGAAPAACPDPLLGYDASSVPTGPLVPTDVDIAGIVAAVLSPFDATTTCSTVIVGFAIGPAPCELPSAIDIVTFDTATPDAPEAPAIYAIATFDAQPLFPAATPGIVEARFHLQTSHVAGLYPFVGAIVRENFCPALLPMCDPARAMRYRAQPPFKGWRLLSDDVPDEPGTDGALYFGLADCAPSGN